MARARLPESVHYVSATFRVEKADMVLVKKVAKKRKISLAQLFREAIMKDVHAQLDQAQHG